MKQKIQHLDYYVVKTIENLERWKYPKLKIEKDGTNVFLGSGTAACVGKLFTEKFNGINLNVSNYKRFFEKAIRKNFASINIVNASGGKDGLKMASYLIKAGFKPNLITCNKDAPAKKFIKEKNIFVFPSFIEPPTYNVSTYSSMIYWLFKEDIKKIKKFINNIEIPNLRKYKYIFFLSSDEYDVISKITSRKVAETLEGIGANGDGFSNGSHGMLRQPNKDRLVFCLNQKYDLPRGKNLLRSSEESNIYELKIDSYLGLILSTYYIIGKNQTDQDTENLLKNYEETFKKLDWKFNKVW